MTEQIVNEIWRDALSQYTTCELVLISKVLILTDCKNRGNSSVVQDFFITTINYLSAINSKNNSDREHPTDPATRLELNKFHSKN
ncbi:MAG: hypothetical protein JAY97_07220, partial [Candidatus Thiodiazotropha sp. 'RUGA']|nr:hypothetical protein [Candidatus Thiodiazotropha sp. 'RUGA']